MSLGGFAEGLDQAAALVHACREHDLARFDALDGNTREVLSQGSPPLAGRQDGDTLAVCDYFELVFEGVDAWSERSQASVGARLDTPEGAPGRGGAGVADHRFIGEIVQADGLFAG